METAPEIFCNQCGTANRADARFCWSCGSKLLTQSSADSSADGSAGPTPTAPADATLLEALARPWRRPTG